LNAKADEHLAHYNMMANDFVLGIIGISIAFGAVALPIAGVIYLLTLVF
jgi:hypothetical protein